MGVGDVGDNLDKNNYREHARLGRLCTSRGLGPGLCALHGVPTVRSMVGSFVGSAIGEAVGSGIGDAVGAGMGAADGAYVGILR